MQDCYSTSRLILKRVSFGDTNFIFELMNTPEWKKFIVNRHIETKEAAAVYVQRIIENPKINYWVVKLHDQQISIGIVTFIKKDYLDHHDIGFAFLTEYAGQGYAYESILTVLNDLSTDSEFTQFLATTVKENTRSIRLLNKLGFQFSHEIQIENEPLLVYAVAKDKIAIDQLTGEFFRIFININQQVPNLNLMHSICLADALFIKWSNTTEMVYNIGTFTEPRRLILTDGTMTEFEESETSEETKITGNIAQRISAYEKKGYLNGIFFHGFGHKLFQFIKKGDGWKISSVVWEDVEN